MTDGLKMRSITETNAVGLAEQMKNNIFNMDWIFDKWYEKLILVAMTVLSAYALWRIFF
jgi:hypothetical protein